MKPATRVKLPEPTEKQIQAAVKRVLQTLGYWFVDTSQPFRAAITPGLSDLIVFARGHIVFVELKTRTGKLSSDQKSFKAHVENNGGCYLVWRSSEDAVKWANELVAGRRSA